MSSRLGAAFVVTAGVWLASPAAVAAHGLHDGGLSSLTHVGVHGLEALTVLIAVALGVVLLARRSRSGT